MRDLLARHGINVNPSGRFPSDRLRPYGSLDTGTPAEARDLAMTSLRWWCLTVLSGTRLQTRDAILCVVVYLTFVLCVCVLVIVSTVVILHMYFRADSKPVAEMQPWVSNPSFRYRFFRSSSYRLR